MNEVDYSVPCEQNEIAMKWKAIGLLIVCCLAGIVIAEDKGFCPPSPPPNTVTIEKSEASRAANAPSDARFVGIVTLLTVISDKGHVCSVTVIRSVDKDFDRQARNLILTWRFNPARKDGHAVPVVAALNVQMWVDSKGKVIQPTQSPTARVGR
jgi:TonB family protein